MNVVKKVLRKIRGTRLPPPKPPASIFDIRRSRLMGLVQRLTMIERDEKRREQ